MKLVMYLPVIDGTKLPFDNGTLLYRTVETDFIPTPNLDRVVLYKYEDEDDEYDGPMWPVRERYMKANGQWEVELAKMVVNPNEHWQNIIKRSLTNGGPYNRESFWYTENDDDPMPKLIKGGWLKYGESKP